MRIPLEELMEKLAVDRVLHPYETQPWLMYDDEQGITCSAEVRMGPGGEDVEAEIQFLYDDDADIPELYVEDGEDDDEDKGGKGGGEKPKTPLIVNGRMQVLILRAEPMSEGKWGLKNLKIRGLSYVNEIHGWDEKGCSFFTMCVQSINMGELPDIDSLIEKEMRDEKGGRGRRGRIGRKGLRMAQKNPHQQNKPGGMKSGM